MNFFTKIIDRFCIKHRNFGIRNLMLYIIIGNAIVYIFSNIVPNNNFLQFLLFNPQLILRGQVWRLVSFIFVPMESRLIFFALMLYFYYFIGSTLERYWGTAKFTLYYLFGVLFTILYGLIYGLITKSSYIALDSVYINLSLFFAFASLFPDTQVLLFFIIPIKMKWIALLDAALFIYEIIINPFPINLLPLVALLNFFLFCGADLIRMIKPNKTKFNKSSSHFREEVHKAERSQQERTYRFKCAVCGRTDTEYPNLEFRYCSRCQGYHCFCEEHINNHIHFTE